MSVDEVKIIVQVNGKLKDRIQMAVNADKAEVEAVALGLAKVKEAMGENAPKKIIQVPNKLVNIVV